MYQRIDYKESNDNAPPRYSAPSAEFKAALAMYADRRCVHCRGTGYIGEFKAVARGRCFNCLPDARWDQIRGELYATGTDDDTGATVCEVRKFIDVSQSSVVYAVVRPELPPTSKECIFPTKEEALAFASKRYNC